MATQKIPFNREAFLEKLQNNGVELLIGVTYKEGVDRGIVIIDNEGKERLIEADTIIVAIGTKPDNRLYEEIKGKIKEVYRAGDCIEPRLIGEAVQEGMRIGMNL